MSVITSQKSIYFVDSNLPDIDALLTGLPEGAEIVMISPESDGVAQMLAAINGREGFDAFHVLTHGAPGKVVLGGSTLSLDNLDDYASALKQLGATMTADADILFYGCNVAEGELGRSFVSQLADLTGADVAASTDLTGAANLGGDWEFEFAAGSVQAIPLEVLNFDATLGEDTSQPGTLDNSPGIWSGHTFQTRINAELTTGDPLNPFRTDCRWDRYSLSDIPNGATVKVYMGDSSTIDDYLQIERNGQILTYNDDAGDGERSYDAYLSWTYQTGDVIRATTYRAGETGTYSLWIGTSATVSGGNPPPPTDIGSQPAPAPTAPTFTDSNSNLGTVADTPANDTALANISGTLTATDTTPTGTLTFSGGGTQTYGTLSVSSNGAFTFNPNETAINTLAADAMAIHTFTVSVTDGSLSSSKNLTVNFSGTNDLPTVTGNATMPGILEDAGNTSTTNAGTTVANLFGSRFADVDAGSSFKGIVVTAIADTTGQGTWRYSTNEGASWSDLTANTTLLATHKLQFVPAANWNGTPGGLTVKVIDNNDGQSVGTATVSITVAPVNDAPTFDVTTKITDTVADTAVYDTDWTGEVTTGTIAAATDIESDAINFSIRGGTLNTGVWTAQGVYGTLTVDASSGAYTYTPTNTVGINALPAGKTVKDSFVFKANDAAGAYTTRELEISITGANDTPQLKTANPIADQSFSGPGFWKFQIPSDLFTDAEGAGLNYTVQVVDDGGDLVGDGTLANNASWLTFNESTRSFSGDPPATWNNAPLNLKVTATDPDGANISDTFTLTLTHTGNQPPVVATPIGRHVASGSAETTEITFADALGGQTLIFNNLTTTGDTPTADDTSVTFGSAVSAAQVAAAVVAAGPTTNYTVALKAPGSDTVVFTAKAWGDVTDTAYANVINVGTFGGTATVTKVADGGAGSVESFTLNLSPNGGASSTILFDGVTVQIDAGATAADIADLLANPPDGSGGFLSYSHWTVTDNLDGTVTFERTAPGNVQDVTIVQDGPGGEFAFGGTYDFTSVTPSITQGTGNETFEVQYSGGLGGTTLDFDDVETTVGNGVTAANAAADFLAALNLNASGAYTAALKEGDNTTVVLTNKVGGNATNIQASDFSGTYTEGTSRLTVDTPTDGGSWTYTFPVGTFSDPDTDTLTYAAYTVVDDTPSLITTTSGNNPVNFDPVSRTFTGNGTGGPFLIELSATDASGSNTTVATRFQLYLDDGLDGDVTVGVAIPAQTWNGPGDKSFQIPANAFNFNDGPPDTFEYSAKLAGEPPTALPAWLTIDPATGELSGNPPADAPASLSIVVTATEKQGGTTTASSNSQTFTLNIASPNDAPTVIAPLADQLVEEGDAVSITTGPVFADADGSSITYAVTQADGSALPSWLAWNWDGTNLSFNGNPPGNLPYLNIKVIGTDAGNDTAESTFTLYLQDPAATGSTGALTSNNPGAVTIVDSPLSINEGQTLTASTPTDPDGNPATNAVTYQWQVLLSGTWTDIAGPRGQGGTLTLTNDEAGKSVRVQAFYTDGGGVAESPVSDAVSVINVETAGVATISGNAAIGEVQTVTLTDGDGLVNVTPSYQWYRSAVNSDSGYTAITGATNSSYVTTSDDGDRYLKVEVGYTDNQNTTYTIGSTAISDRTNAIIQRGEVPPVAFDDTGSVTEAGGTNNGTGGVNITNGTSLFNNDTDSNAGDTKTVTEVRLGGNLGSGAMASDTGQTYTLAGTFGTLTVNKTTGGYTYTLNQTNSRVEALSSSSTPLTDIFNYTIEDSTRLTASAKLTISIGGTNDQPTLTAYPESSTVVEDLAGFVNTGLILSDPDLGAGANFALKLAVNSGRLIVVDPTAASGLGITMKGSDTGTLTLTGNMATITNWLQGDVIKYAAPPNVLGNNIATLTFSANDGSGYETLGTQSLNTTASNDAPILDLDGVDSTSNNFTTLFRPRGEAAKIVGTNARITDADTGDTLVSGTVSIATGALDNEFGTIFETLTSSAGSSYNGSQGAITITGSGTPSITLSGAGTHADYQAVLQTITYRNANPNAYSGDRTISISVTDSAGVNASASNLASFTTAAPNTGIAVGQKIFLVNTVTGQTTDTGKSVATVIDSTHFVASGPISGLTPTSALSFATTAAVGSPVTGTTSFTIETANTSIANGLTIFKNGTTTGLTVTGVSGSTITASGAITLVATDVLSFQTTATNNTPIPATTTVRVPWTSVVDMDGTDSTSRNFTTSYTEDGAAIAVATSTASIENQAINIKTFTVTLDNPLDGASEELSISASMVQTLAAKGITATVAANKHSITFTTGQAGAAATDMQLGLRAVKYINIDQNPSITPRTISTSVVDVANENGVTATTTINIIPVNDAPVIGGDRAAGVVEGGIYLFTTTDLNPTDDDDDVSSLLYRVTTVDGKGATTNGTLFRDANSNNEIDTGEAIALNGTFTQGDVINDLIKYKHAGGDNIADAFGFKLEDGLENGVTAPQNTFSITVTPTNDAPTLTTASTASPVPFNENPGSAVLLFSGASVGTGDTTGAAQSIQKLVLTVAGVADGADEKLTVNNVEIALVAVGTTPMNSGSPTVVGLSYAVSVSGGVATVTLTHDGLSATQVATLVDALAYRNASNAPTTTDRVITLTQIQDTGGTDADNDEVVDGVDTASLEIARTVTITAVDTAPQVATNNGISLNDGATEIINTTELSVTDPDTAASNVVYRITQATGQGTLFRDVDSDGAPDAGEALGLNSTFTQADLAANRIKYLHTDATGADSFKFTVADAATTLSDATFNIAVGATPTTPGVSGGGTTTASTSGGTPLFPNVTVTPPTGETVQSVSFTVTGVQDGADETLNINGQQIPLVAGTTVTTGTAPDTVTYTVVSNASGGLTVTVTDNTVPGFTGPQAEDLIESVTLSNNEVPPTPGTRNVTLSSVVNQNAGGSTTTTNTPNVTSTVNVNTAIEPFGTPNVPTPPDGSSIQTLTFSVTGVQDGANEVLKVNGQDIPLVPGTTTINGIVYTVTVDGSGNASVTVTAPTPPGWTESEAETLLGNTTYVNNATPPTAGERSISLASVTPVDGTGTVGTPAPVTGQGTSVAPTGGTGSSTPIAGETLPDVPIGSSVDSLTFTVTGLNPTTGNANESLTIGGHVIPLVPGTTTHGTAPNQVTYTVTVDGNGVATVTATPETNYPEANAQSIVQGVTYNNTATPATGPREVSLTSMGVQNDTTNVVTPTPTPGIGSTLLLNNTNTPPVLTPFPSADLPALSDSVNNSIQTLSFEVTGVRDGANEVIKINGQNIPLVPGTTIIGGITYTVAVDGNGKATVTVTDPTAPGWSEAQAESLVQGVTYVNNATSPTPGDRGLSLKSITEVNNTTGTPSAPTPISNVTTTTAPAAGSGSTSPMAGDTLPDIPNTSDVDSLTFRVTGVQDGSNEVLSFGTAPNTTTVPLVPGTVPSTNPPGNYVVTVDGNGTATVVFTPTTNLNETDAAALTQSTQYTNTATPPTAGTRDVSLSSMQVVASGGEVSTVNTPNVGSNVTVSANSNTAPSFTGDRAFEVNEGATYILTTGDIGASDAQLAAGSLVYKLTTAPGQGQLFRDSNGNGLVNTGEEIALNGTFTQAEVSAGTIKYRHGVNEPAAENFQLTVSDGQATSSPAPVTVTVNQANDAPTLSLTPKTNPSPSFTEGGGAATLFTGATASTVESAQRFKEIKLTVAGVRDTTEKLLIDGVNVALTHNTSGTTTTNAVGYSVSVTGTTATITLSHAGATAEQVQALLTGLAYSNSSDNPTTGTRTITVTQLQDSGDTTNGGQNTAYLNLVSQVSVTGSNSAPTLAGSGEFTVLEGGSHALTTNELIAADADTPLSSLLYHLMDEPLKGTLYRDLNGNAINDTGDVTLAANGTFSHAELLTGKVRYAHGGEEAGDSFVVTVNDGTLGAATPKTITVNRTAVNDAPSIGNLGSDTMTYPAHEGTLTYRFLDVTTSAASGAPSSGNPNATVSDSDSTDFNGGSLRVGIIFNNNPAADSLRIFNTSGGITTDTTKVYYNGAEIGTYSGGSGTSDLLVNFTAVTPEIAQALIRSIQFANSETTPAFNSRTVRFALNDGDGAATTADVNVNIQSNLRPSILNGSGFFIAENTSLVTVLTAENPAGVTGPIVYSISDSTAANNADAAIFQVNSSNGTLSFKAAPNFESLLDAGANNVYNVVVRATSTTLNTYTESALNVNVVDVEPETSAAGDTAGPVFGFATVNGNSLVMTYTDASNLDATNAPPTSAFAVSGNTVSDVAVNATTKTVTLTLGTAVVSTDTVTVAYNDSSTNNDAAAIQDSLGNDAANLTATTATNTTTPATPVAPPSSGGGGGGGGTSSSGTTTTVTPGTITGGTSTTSTGTDGTRTTTTTGTVGTVTVVETVVVTTAGETIRELVYVPVSSGTAGAATTPVSMPLLYEQAAGSDSNTTITLPGGIGLTSTGDRTPTTSSNEADLIKLIQSTVSNTDPTKSGMLAAGQSFLDQRTDGSTLWINKIVLTATAGAPVPSTPIIVDGSANNASSTFTGDKLEALVIDASQLPVGSVIELENVDFAVVIGEGIVIRGGNGANTVFGGAGSQNILLGPDDDVLYGGDGDDVVGSAAGADLIFGNAGNDVVFGGAGADLLHGGGGNDVATYSGNMANYEITRDHGKTIVRSLDRLDDIDTLLNVETIRFDDQSYSVENSKYHTWTASLYNEVLNRQAEIGGFQYWSGEFAAGKSLGNIALNFLVSAEHNANIGQAFSELSKGQQVDLFYQYFLGREAEQAGHDYWVDVLESGYSLEIVAQLFMESVEMQGKYLQPNQWDFFL